MGKLSIFKPTLDLPLGMLKIPVDGRFVCMLYNNQFTIFEVESGNSTISISTGSTTDKSFEFTVNNKNYKVYKGILSKKV